MFNNNLSFNRILAIIKHSFLENKTQTFDKVNLWNFSKYLSDIRHGIGLIRLIKLEISIVV